MEPRANPANELSKMRVRELTSRITSREDLYDFLSKKGRFPSLEVQICMPSYDNCTVLFMKHIMQGKKKVGIAHSST